MINGRALIKNPDAITGVSFENYTLTVRTSVCTYSDGITGKISNKTKVPGQMTIEISSCGANALRVRYRNHKMDAGFDSRFIDVKPSQMGSIDETPDHIIFKSNMFEAKISKSEEFGIDFYFAGRYLTSSHASNGGASYVTESGVASNYKVCDTASSYETLSMESDEHLYGLGSTGASMVLNGREVKLKNVKASGSGISNYQNIPFYISSKKYGVFLNTSGISRFSFGTDYASAVSFGTATEELEYIIFASGDMLSVLNLFDNFLGISHPAPFSSTGTAIVLADDKTVTDVEILDYVDSLKDSGIQLSELWLSYLWLEPNDPLGFSFDAARFPDPAAFSRKLHDRGISLGVTINPYITENSVFYDECLENDILIRTADGNIYMRDCEFAGAAILDMTNMAARTFIQQRTDALLRLGVDMIEADFRYNLFDFRADEVKFCDGSKPCQVNNAFASLFNNAVYETVSRVRGLANAMVISNAVTIGSQLYPYTNVIPENKSFEAMGLTLKRCLNLGLSGISTVNIDTPLLTPGKDDQLFIRWAQLGFLAPHMRITLDVKTPITAFSGALDTLKLFANLRKGMLPHFYSINCEAANLGAPAMRPLLLECENDMAARNANQQYMLGSQIMVAPVMNKDNKVMYYVPAGVWTNLLTREKVKGPCYRNITADSNNIPILVKPNSIVTSWSPEANTFGDPLNNLTFTVFELENGSVAAFEVFSENAEHSGLINILKQGNKITVRTDGLGQNKRIVLSGIKNVVSVSESIPNVSDWGTSVDFTSKELIITLG